MRTKLLHMNTMKGNAVYHAIDRDHRKEYSNWYIESSKSHSNKKKAVRVSFLKKYKDWQLLV